MHVGTCHYLILYEKYHSGIRLESKLLLIILIRVCYLKRTERLYKKKKEGRGGERSRRGPSARSVAPAWLPSASKDGDDGDACARDCVRKHVHR